MMSRGFAGELTSKQEINKRICKYQSKVLRKMINLLQMQVKKSNKADARYDALRQHHGRALPSSSMRCDDPTAYQISSYPLQSSCSAI
jgi:hypothetical protein